MRIKYTSYGRFTDEEWNNLKDNLNHLNQVDRFLTQYNWSSEAIANIRLEMDLMLDPNYANANASAGYPSIGSPEWEQSVIFPWITILLEAEYNVQCFVLKRQHPDWSNTKISLTAAWNILKETSHTALDICGVVLEPCDAANGVLYIIEGDGVNASISFAATLPIAGWVATGAKYASISIKTLKGTDKVLPLVKNVTTGLIEFGNRSDLRKVLNITNTANEAHHILPWAKSTNPLVQKAASSNKAFHMNHPGNGIELPKFRDDFPDGVHANHPNYDALVERDLNLKKDELARIFGSENNIPPDAARDAVIQVQNKIRQIINNNPGVKINDLRW